MKEWYTAAELAGMALPGIPETESATIRRAKREGWGLPGLEWSEGNPLGVWRKRDASGGGVEYHYSLLPPRAKAAVLRRDRADQPPAAAEVKARLSGDEAWKRFDTLSDSRKDKARRRLKALLDVDALVVGGMPKDAAIELICAPEKIPVSTYYEWASRVQGVERPDWLPHLVDHYAGRTVTAEMSPDAWELIKADYLRESQPGVTECYNRLIDVNVKQGKGWSIPSKKTVERKLNAIDHRILTLKRQGKEAHDRSFPALERDRSYLHALEAVNYDGHKIDVFVQWEDGGKTERAFILAFQDLYSGMILGWRLDRCENAFGFRLAFLDMVEDYGIPVHVFSDNTMAAAAKENSGGSRWRHRYKIREDDPIGLFAGLGAELHFTRPAHGQSKPIERAFGDLSRYISKAAECEGAYTGNSPENKPANYGSKVVPIATLIKVVEREIARFNTRPDRNSATAKGVSYRQIFEESYKQAIIRRASPEALRMWMLASEPVTCRKPDGAIWLWETRYWAEPLAGMIGKKVVARFDPDNLTKPAMIYRLDGSFVCAAEALGKVQFMDQQGAKDQAAKVKRRNRLSREMADLEVSMTVADVAAMQPVADDPEPLEARVVRPSFGNLALKMEPEEAPEERKPATVLDFGAFGRGVAMHIAASKD